MTILCGHHGSRDGTGQTGPYSSGSTGTGRIAVFGEYRKRRQRAPSWSMLIWR
jgi:hypothetical protein